MEKQFESKLARADMNR